MSSHHAALAALVLAACGARAPQHAELIASDKTWGNTEGPALDSKGALFFCARGSFKGIVEWTPAGGGRHYVAVDAVRGPGGLWFDDEDNIYVTGPGERKIFKVDRDKRVTVLAENFEPNPKQARGPNDLILAPDKSIYFTDPNGFEGDGPPGTIYRLDPAGKVTVFDASVVGPNGITISQDGKWIFVGGNVAKSTARITRLEIRADGSAGAKSEIATIPECIADGMDIDREGNIWLTCYSFGTAYRVSPDGRILDTVVTEQKALTNCQFGRGADAHSLYLTSSDMARETGYVYRIRTAVPGFR
ncbi:MAG: SMP-30/gluconolactonase/LRE family protein [Acidobacteria bacterium]|nr:SMP-30/gluconolactonase/LRE family protein [Acidobacteriota bacterium]